MPKQVKFEDWKAPWEEKGEEFNAETARKYIFDLTTDRDRLATEKAQVAQERDTFKQKAEEYETKDLSEVDRLQRELEKAKESPKEDPALALENARLTLALEYGLTVKQAKRLSGSTPEELAADVDDLKESLGLTERKREETDAPGGRFSTGNGHGAPSEEDDPAALAKYV